MSTQPLRSAATSRTLRAELPVARYLALIALAVALRIVIAGPPTASSQLAGGVFAAMLAAVAITAAKPLVAKPVSVWRNIGVGVAGAGVLVLFPYHAVGFATFGVRPAGPIVSWSILVSAVAVSEEFVFRGVLFRLVLEKHGSYAATLGCALVFALAHVPLYGWQAFPLDLAVGIWLGAIRLWSGVGGAAITHTLADLATGWLVL